VTARVESAFRVYIDELPEPICTVEAHHGDVYVNDGEGGEGSVGVQLASGSAQLREVALCLGRMADEMAKAEGARGQD
jgi:hypothetical protein